MSSRLSAKQRNVLDLISQAGPIAISNAELADRLGLPPEGTSQTAASLVRRGLVTRVTVRTATGRRVAYRKA